jgi:hypothetical protein
MTADKILLNGKFYSMVKEGETFQAMAIKGDKIFVTGTNEEIKTIIAKETIDLKGKVVLPGFIDTHQHILSYCEGLEAVDLRETKSIKEVQQRLEKKVQETPKGQWIRGVCFDHEKFVENRFPTRYDLDEVSKEHPILISRYCMHGYVANSLALQEGGIGKGYQQPANGSVEFDAAGEPTGVLWEEASEPIIEKIPVPLATYEQKKEAIKRVCMDMASYGITTVHTYQGKFCDAKEYIGIYQDLEAEDGLPIRVYVSFDELPNFGIKTGFGSKFVRYGNFKIYSDGSLGSRAAALFEPYSDQPKVKGVENYSQEYMNEKVKEAHDQGLQVAIHAIGDRGLDIAITAIENAYSQNPRPNSSFRIIHVTVTNEELIERMKKLPVILDVQPKFITSNLYWAENRVGKERAKYVYAFNTFIKNGFIVTAGSDCPVEPYNPFLGIYAAVNRQDFNGYPKGGWNPQEKVTIFDAISMYTRNGAYASLEENLKGTLQAGKYADFIVVDSDPFAVEPQDLHKLKVMETFVGGKLIFKR